MAEEGDSGEKTEQPTGRRLGQAREEGMVPRSQDLSQVLSISTAFLLIAALAPSIWHKLTVVVTASLTSRYASEPLTINAMRYHFYGLIVYLAPEILLLLVVTAVVGSLSTAIQTNFLWSPKLFKPKFSHLNPINGLKRIFSIQNTFQVVKAIFKLAIIGPIAYFAFFELFPQMINLMQVPVTDLLPFAAIASGLIFWRIIKLLLLLAIIDYIWSKYRVSKQLKMSKTEVKEEAKATEGDEKTKMRIRARALQRARQRMMDAVKTADVVVTNPTHLAVALEYTMEKGSAPKVVAKGRGYIAEQIKKIARENRVPVIERKSLARALFADVEVGRQIPYELYAAVAELLAFVYRLKGRGPKKKAKN